jgi:hypothetical protein
LDLLLAGAVGEWFGKAGAVSCPAPGNLPNSLSTGEGRLLARIRARQRSEAGHQEGHGRRQFLHHRQRFYEDKEEGKLAAGPIFRGVLPHSLMLAALMGCLVMLQAYVFPWMIP